MNKLDFEVKINDVNRTLFKYLINVLNNTPVSRIEKLFRNKDIKLNGKKNYSKNYLLKFKDKIEVFGIENPFLENTFNTNIKKNFDIIFENEDILIVNKEKNVIMHDGNNSLDSQILSYLKFKQNDSFIPSHIGRLDKLSSGLVVYAKNYATLIELEQKQKDFEKIYTFKPSKNLEKKDYLIKTNLIKSEKDHCMKISKFGKEAITKIFFNHDKNIWLAQILTGRKHQIRASLAFKLFNPILGDSKYGAKHDKRLYLHSYKLILHNLDTNWDYLNEMSFEAPIPWT